MGIILLSWHENVFLRELYFWKGSSENFFMCEQQNVNVSKLND